MAITYNLKDLSGIYYNSKAVSKVLVGNTLVFENIKHQTGNLYYMTSNNTPAPFTVTDISTANLGGDSNTNAWKSFGGSYYAKKHNVNGRYTGAQLMFNSLGKKIYPIKISAACASEDGGAGYSTGFRIEVDVYLPSGTWQNIIRKDVSNGYQSVSTTMDGATEVIGIRCKAIYGSGPEQYMCIYSCSITEWNEK